MKKIISVFLCLMLSLQMVTASGNIVSLLPIKQLDNHEIIFLILKMIRGQKFAEINCLAQTKWFDAHDA